MRGKPQPEKISDHPGPGFYEANPHVVKDKIPSVKISHGTKKSLFGADDGKLGPGNYDPKNINSGPSFQIRGSQSDIQTSNIPGPRSYDAYADAVRDRSRGAKFSNSP